MIRISDEEFFKFREKIKNYSVKELKKIHLNYCNTSSGASLLHTSMYQPDMLKKLVQAGIDINHKDDHGLNAAYHIFPGHTPYENLKFLIESGIDISHTHNHNLLHDLSRQYAVNDKEQEDTLTKIQILLIMKNRNLSNLEGGYGVSLLTPDTLRYLKNYQNVDIFRRKYPAGENVLREVVASELYNNTYGKNIMFERLLNLMTKEEINNVSYRQKNVAFYCDQVEHIYMLKKHGLNFAYKDQSGKGILEKRNSDSISVLVALIECGADLAEETYIDVAKLDHETFLEKYDWTLAYYDFIRPLALEQYAIYERNYFSQNLETIKPVIGKSVSRL